MKRTLFKTVSLIPAPEGQAVDREGFLSAVLAVSVGEITGSPDAAVLSVKVEHADQADGEFAAVPDTMLNPEQATLEGGIPDRKIAGAEELSLDLDLLGCKRFIKVTPSITFEGGTSPAASRASYALALGDSVKNPV